MITQEDIDGMNDITDDFESVKSDVEQALRFLRSAQHWLDETGNYSSDRLDDAYDNIVAAKTQLLKLIERSYDETIS